MKSRILIVDDHEIMRKGLRTLLSSRRELEICGEAVDGKDAIEKAKRLHPDLIIMDVSLPHMSGLDATRQILREDPSIKVLIFTMHESEHMRADVERSGAKGYVRKSDAATKLIDAISTLASDSHSS